MTNFKIEQVLPSSTLDHRIIRLPISPSLNINIPTMSLLTYDLQTLLVSISDFLEGQNNQQLLSKTLKVLGSSLNDKKLSEGVEKSLMGFKGSERKIYELMVLWSLSCRGLIDILLKFSSRLRSYLVSLMVSLFLLDRTSGEDEIKNKLSQIVPLISKSDLLTSFKEFYSKKGQPFQILVQKIQKISSSSAQTLAFIQQVLIFAVQKSDSKVQQMVLHISLHQKALQYLIKFIPNVGSTLVRHLRQTISLDSVFRSRTASSPLSQLVRSATKEWLEEGHNFWETVDRYYSIGNDSRQKVLLWGKEINKEGAFNLCLTVKYLYSYFEGIPFQFDFEDRMLSSIQYHDGWIDAYRGVSQCVSAGYLNLITINVTNSVPHWKPIDPFRIDIQHKGLRKFVDIVRDDYKAITQNFLSKNKKIELVFSTFLISRDKSEAVVTFQQLIDLLDKENFVTPTYRKQYIPYKQQTILKEEPRKDHNIVVEARLVRLLKRNKGSWRAEWLSKEAGYEEGVVALALKRLCNKGIVQADEKQTFSFVP